MRWVEHLKTLWLDLRHRRRRVWRTNGRSHVEIRALPDAEHRVFAKAVEERLRELDGVHWARVNGPLRRIVAAHADHVTTEALVGAIDEVEQQLRLHGFPFSDDGLEHPADREPLVRNVVEMGVDVAGLTVGLGLRAARVKRAPLPLDLAAVTTTLEGIPQVRELLDRRLGRATTDLTLHFANAFTSALVQGMVGPAVSVAHRYLRVRELNARRDAWMRWEPDLCGGPEQHPTGDNHVAARPVPLPEGPIEDYSGKAVAAALGGFGFGIASTRSLHGATASIFGGFPKPARLGREAFAAHLGRRLADRDIVVMNGEALRVLDRIDCVLIAHELLDDARTAAAPEALDQVVAVLRGAHLRTVAQADGPIPFRVDERVAAHSSLAAEIRRLQATGYTVCLLSARFSREMAASDLGVGIVRNGEVPWGAHIMCRQGLSDVPMLVDAMQAARNASKQSVQLSLLEAGAGLLLSIEGLEARTVQRIMSAANATSLAALVNGVRMAHAVRERPMGPPPQRQAWHALETDDVLQEVDTTAAGLSDASVRDRAAPAPQRRPGAALQLGRMALDELFNPLAPLLAAGAGLSALMGELVDAGLIGAVAGVNATVGAAQRFRAERALSSLELRERRLVRTRRAGAVHEVDVGELVVGDVIELHSGEVVPADCRIVEANGLEVDESSLTGESLPVSKSTEPCAAEAVLADRRNMLYEDTLIAAGTAVAVVTAVGDGTEARRAMSFAGEAPKSGVEARLEFLTALTAPVAAASGLAVIGSGVARNRRSPDVIGTGVSMAVAAVPEGLPLLATMAQLAAARRLSHHGALVRNPRAVEALGRVDVVCADKTGTLTEGHIRLTWVSGAAPGQQEPDGEDGRRALAAALRASPAGERLPHLTDQATVEGARTRGIRMSDGIAGWHRVTELPFEPGRGFHAVIGEGEKGSVLSVKGAPEVLLPRCTRWRRPEGTRTLEPADRVALEEEVIRLARSGLRVLAVAERTVEPVSELSDEMVEELELLGMLGFSDPVRPTAKAAVASLRRAGVGVMMLTGDHPSTADAIASELALLDDGGVMTGAEIDALDDESLRQRLSSASVVARVTPAQKVRIVRSLQQAGRTVAMTGDGANDAPAIRLANVGIALGAESTTAARHAADLVVTDERIETIVEAVLEGRALWSSVRDAVALLVGGNLGEIGFTLLGGVATGRPPLNARQLLLVNMLTDTLPALTIAIRPPTHRGPEQLLGEGPEASLGDVLVRDIGWRAFWTSSATTGAWLAARMTGSRKRADTVGLLTLVGSQLGQTMVSGRRSPLVLGSSFGSFALLVGTTQAPGLRHFFGCRAVGPIGLLQATTAATAATAGSALIPRNMRWLDPVWKQVARVAGRDRDEPAGAEPEPESPEPAHVRPTSAEAASS